MLLRKIEELRKRPKAVRNRYAFVTAVSITLLIVMIWGISLPSRLGQSTTVSKNKNTESGLSDLSEQLVEIRNYVGDSLDQIQSQAKLIETADDNEVATSTEATSSPEILDSKSGTSTDSF